MSCQALQRREQYDHQAMNQPLKANVSALSCSPSQVKPMSNDQIGGYARMTDSYASIDSAFSPSTSMAEFENKLVNQNPLLAQNLINRPHPDDGPAHAPFIDQPNTLFAPPRHDSCGNDTLQAEAINKNIQGVLEGFRSNQDRINMLSSDDKLLNNINDIIVGPGIDDIIAGASGSNCLESLPQNGVTFPLSRRQYYNPERLGTELLEGYDVLSDLQLAAMQANANVEQTTGMSIFKLVLLIVLVAALIYGIYYLYTNNTSSKSMSIKSPGPMETSGMSSINRSIEKLLRF